MDGGVEPFLSSTSKTNKKSMDPVKSHKEAKTRRRQRINPHLSTLRTLLPKTTKKDKASLLAEVVRHVEELRKQADDMTFQVDEGMNFDHRWLFPGESDEATLNYCENEARMIQATVCYENRIGLNCVVLIVWANGSGGDEDVILGGL
ncbi:hypothetical protein K2173_028506 [Erythroxylum novogranatense]|uniref:BHLH domain-containing protein n=1 Tax=Erythroxylum novogranatense TaxID=1862640 RepID=A0AAV8U550_9ROSI|nr:hypothetical protein K2173_028506 [Erythroxylum novogranatense]